MADKDRQVKIEITGDESGLDKSTKRATGALNSFKGAATAITAVVGSAFVAMGIKAVKAFDEADQAQRRTIALLKATGSQAGVTAKQIFDLAGSLQKTTKYSDEALIGLQTTLLKFGNIKSDVFEPTTRAIVDMAAALNMDLSSAAQVVGRALENPAQGMRGLKQAGIEFTDEQKKQVEGLLKANDLFGVQQIILGQLEGKFKGTAEQMAAGTGVFTQIGNEIGEIWEQIGGVIFRVIEPLVVKVRDWIVAVKESGAVQNGLYNVMRAGEIIFGALGNVLGVLVRGFTSLIQPLADVNKYFGELSGTGKESARTIDLITAGATRLVGYVTQAGLKVIQYFYDLKAAILDARSAMVGFVGGDTSGLDAASAAAKAQSQQYSDMAGSVGAESQAAAQGVFSDSETQRFGSDAGQSDLYGTQTDRKVVSTNASGGGGSGGNGLEEQLGYEIPAGSTDAEQLAMLAQAFPTKLLTPDQRTAYLEELRSQKEDELSVLEEYQMRILEAEENHQSEMNSTIGGWLVKNLSDKRLSWEEEKALKEQVDNQMLQLISAFGEKGKNVMKAYQIAQATMNIAEGVTKTIAKLGMPQAIPFVALTIAAGAAQISTIAGAAQGGIVGGTDTGKDNRTMAVRSGEMIVPSQYVTPLLPTLGQIIKQEEESGRIAEAGGMGGEIQISFKDSAGDFINAVLIRDRAAGVI